MGLIFFLFVGLIINFIRYYIGHLSKTKVRKFTQYSDVQETNYGSSSYKVLDLFDKSDSILSIYKKFKNADDDVKLNILRYLELFKSNNDIYSQALALIYKKENLNNFKELENRQISKSVNYKPESKQNSKNINKKKLFFAFYGIIMIFVFLPIIIDDLTENEESVITTDKNTSTTNKRKPTTQDYFYKNVIWKDNYNAQRSKTVKINKSDYYSSVKNRKSISRNSSWRDMANRVIRNDKDKLEELIKMFDNIIKDD